MWATLISNPKNHHSRAASGRESANISKIQVEHYDDARLDEAVLRKHRIGTAPEPFVVNCFCVVTSLGEQVGNIIVQILVDLESHQAAVGVKGMTVSRASSAAY